MPNYNSDKTLDELFFDALKAGDAYFVTSGRMHMHPPAGQARYANVCLQNPVGSGKDLILLKLLGMADANQTVVWSEVIVNPSVATMPTTVQPVINMNWKYLTTPCVGIVKADVADHAMVGVDTGTEFAFGQSLTSYDEYAVRVLTPGAHIGLTARIDSPFINCYNIYAVLLQVPAQG